MDVDEIMKLFDSCWFELRIFEKQPKKSTLSSFESNPDREIEKPQIWKLPSLHTRSMSDQLSSFNSGLWSPDSVLLHSPKQLHTILSGKEIAGEDPNDDVPTRTTEETEQQPKKKPAKRGKKRGETKSLSDLEFEELKGFMDLGFVFSEEDKDSSLASIIPGLQRLGKREKEQEKEQEKDSRQEQSTVVSRPYLSEAWEVLDKRKEQSLLMNWRVTSLGNEMDVKDNLKWWAHAVASTVR